MPRADSLRPCPLLQVQSLTSPSYPSSAPPLWSSVNFTVEPSSILVLRGPSGCGKSVLLKSIAQLLVYPLSKDPNLAGKEVLLKGRTPVEWGVPVFRSRCLYLPQRPALLPGTPRNFFKTLLAYKSRSTAAGGGRDKKLRDDAAEEEDERSDTIDPVELAKEWGVEPGRWDNTWGSLSGGEAQRIALAVAIALQPDVLLLDEPTSALDSHATQLVEQAILRGINGRKQTCIWITHSDDQAKRVATHTLDLERFMTGRGNEERV